MTMPPDPPDTQAEDAPAADAEAVATGAELSQTARVQEIARDILQRDGELLDRLAD